MSINTSEISPKPEAAEIPLEQKEGDISDEYEEIPIPQSKKRCSSFEEMGLDNRLLRAVARLGHTEPTPIQSSAIILALQGKDILARAKTGSGKTLAYLLPVLHLCLHYIENGPKKEVDLVKALILVPTKELAEQVLSQLKQLKVYSPVIRCLNLASDTPVSMIKSQLKEKPHIVIGTPSKALSHLQDNSLQVRSSLKQLVVDEADLALSFGYEQDVQKIMPFLPKIVQGLLMSATVNEDVDKLKQLVLRNPAILRLEEKEDESAKLVEFCITCSRTDKFLLLYVILMLQLVRGKCLIFVNGIDPCYRLKLFLEHFGLKAGVLNSELPHNSRHGIIEEFNRGALSYLIASDENTLQGEKDSDDEENKEEPKAKGKRKGRLVLDKEYGVSRGVDFKNVAAVINFDVPFSVKAYTHRIGRTARAGKRGMGLTLVASDVTEEEERFNTLKERRETRGAKIQPYKFDMEQVDGFRYRAEDVLSKVTKARIREARLSEVKKALLNSQKLQTHFEDRPQDLEYLQRTTKKGGKAVEKHLKDVPVYLIPKINSVTPASTQDIEEDNLTKKPFRKFSKKPHKANNISKRVGPQKQSRKKSVTSFPKTKTLSKPFRLDPLPEEKDLRNNRFGS